MYVEKLSPANGAWKQTLIVMVHGMAQTGTNFLNKPDSTRGWASQFIGQGYEIYIVDRTSRGRSASTGSQTQKVIPSEMVEMAFTATKQYMFWPQAINHTQWPRTGVKYDPIFDAFYASDVQFIDDAVYQQSFVQEAGAALLDKIGKLVILLDHSQGSYMPSFIADKRPHLTKALVLLELAGPAFKDEIFNLGMKNPRCWGLWDIPVTYEPLVTDPKVKIIQQVHPARDNISAQCILQSDHPEPRKLANFQDIPILVVTRDAHFHATNDYCSVAYLRQAGCNKTELMELGNIGIHGNGHMLSMEKNSAQIQEAIEDWLRRV
ncbi:hypothetical protein SGCOL_003824 [Colletotrichum sp. CLE4]